MQRDVLRVASDDWSEITLAEVMCAVQAVCKIGIRDMRSPRRSANLVRARFIYFAAAHKFTSRSTTQIGMAMGNRDHTTVLHGMKRVAKDRWQFEPELSQVYAQFQRAKEAA